MFICIYVFTNGIDINNVDTLQFESMRSSIYCAFIGCLNTAQTNYIINIHFVVYGV